MKKPDQVYALKVDSVSKNFDGVQAVRSANLAVPIGERRALIGPNGAGKTTLFNLIAGELSLDEGKIEMFGIDVTKKSVQQRAKLGLGRTFQISKLFPALTVEENLFLAGAANKNIEFKFLKAWKNYDEERTWLRQVAEQVELTDYLEEKVSEISHGLQRQLELGMAVAMHPRLIMLDEPAAGLSPSERIMLIKLIKKLPGDVTLVLIEHNMEIVLDIAEQITVLHRGSVIAEGPSAEIKRNREVQDIYFGSSNE
ncbi:MAG: ABC transporter ATP-binding protein [Anaerolineaceae bacterium]|nr:ABC transporter ATP-binding protein [Anaerolineaceae bacterium]